MEHFVKNNDKWPSSPPLRVEFRKRNRLKWKLWQSPSLLFLEPTISTSEVEVNFESGGNPYDQFQQLTKPKKKILKYCARCEPNKY